MQLILFARDDSAALKYQTDNYHLFDLVDITDLSDDDIGRGIIESPDFYIVDCDCTYDDVKHLTTVYYNMTSAEPELINMRLYSLDGLPAPYYNQLIATGRDTIPLGIIIANQRIKSG